MNDITITPWRTDVTQLSPPTSLNKFCFTIICWDTTAGNRTTHTHTLSFYQRHIRTHAQTNGLDSRAIYKDNERIGTLLLLFFCVFFSVCQLSPFNYFVAFVEMRISKGLIILDWPSGNGQLQFSYSWKIIKISINNAIFKQFFF